LEAQGFQVRFMPHAFDQQAYLAGRDADRLSDIHTAFADPSIDAILCARGGYGAMRLLDGLDVDLIRQHPKSLVGFSDITVLHAALWKYTGLVSFYGPMLTSNLVHVDLNEPEEAFSREQLFRMLSGQVGAGDLIPNLDAYTCFTPGQAEGRLLGGNLSLMTALAGTRYMPDLRGAILFLEDWHEQYYTLDRQFQQLRLAGVFEEIAGLILCDFSEIPDEYDYSLCEQLRQLTSFLTVPVGYGFSVGHGAQCATLPMGIAVAFDATHGQLRLLESPLA
jgi:muramoyltetrapeptide carboxypeptidase